MEKETELVETVTTRKMRYFGHIRRHKTISNTMMEGNIEGKRPQGRARKCWRDTIKDSTGEKMSVCNEAALDRDEWRIMASNLCNETEPWYVMYNRLRPNSGHSSSLTSLRSLQAGRGQAWVQPLDCLSQSWWPQWPSSAPWHIHCGQMTPCIHRYLGRQTNQLVIS